MLRTRVLAGCVLLLLPACALPVRDNAFDPTNAPTASLRVVDLGEDCSAPSATAVYAGIVSASRGRCLALDARDSASPLDHDLTFAFTVTTTTGGELASPSGAAGVADLAPLGEVR